MKTPLAALLLTVAGLVGCSSNSTVGPQGPQGDPGPKGDTGASGTPGISVLSASLSPGNTDCPAGGSQFTSVSGTTFACNGTAGPRIVLKTANGDLIGIAFPALYASQQNWIGVGFVADRPAFAQVDQSTGRVMTDNFVYFSLEGCAGIAAIRTLGTVQNYAYAGVGSNRLFVATSGVSGPFLFLSRYDSNGPGCVSTGGVQNVAADTFPAAEIRTAPYPFALPLTLAYE